MEKFLLLLELANRYMIKASIAKGSMMVTAIIFACKTPGHRGMVVKSCSPFWQRNGNGKNSDVQGTRQGMDCFSELDMI